MSRIQFQEIQVIWNVFDKPLHYEARLFCELKKYGKNAAAYAAEWFVLQETQNPRLINESGLKLRVGYNGARTVMVQARCQVVTRQTSGTH